MADAAAPSFISGDHLVAWQRLLRAHGVLVRRLDAELQEAEGLTLSDYDVLVQLREAEGHALRMGDLSRCTMLTRSGMTRLVDGLVRDGLVERKACPEDLRVTWAALTPGGEERLARARTAHHDGIRRLFADHLDDAQAATLAQLLGKIPAVAVSEERDDARDLGCTGA